MFKIPIQSTYIPQEIDLSSEVDDSTLQYTAGGAGLAIKPSGVDTTQIKDESVTYDKLGTIFPFPGQSLLYFADAPSSVGQGTWVRGNDAQQEYGFYEYNNGGDGDNLVFNIPKLPIGKYHLSLLFVKSADAGVMSVSFDGNDKLSAIDGYASSTTRNQSASSESFDVSSVAVHTLTARVNTNSGRSRFYFTLITLTRDS